MSPIGYVAGMILPYAATCLLLKRKLLSECDLEEMNGQFNVEKSRADVKAKWDGTLLLLIRSVSLFVAQQGEDN